MVQKLPTSPKVGCEDKNNNNNIESNNLNHHPIMIVNKTQETLLWRKGVMFLSPDSISSVYNPTGCAITS